MKFRVCAVSLFLLLLPGLTIAQNCSGGYVGTAFLNHNINWSQTGDLYFSVAGAPANVCGDFTSTRNGSFYDYGSVVCTNANGQTTMGPWTWANTSADQTDTNLLIAWPNATCTKFATNHYWDKTCPTPMITSPFGRPPTSFSGTGDDGNSTIGFWGAGFGSWSTVKLQFKNDTSGLYWNPSTDDYDLPSPPDINAITSGLGTIGPGTNDSPSYHITWSTGTVPSIHQPGDSYTWTVTLGDNESLCANSSPRSFTCGRFC